MGTEMVNLLFEIGSEEIPASFMEGALRGMEASFGDLAARARLEVEDVVATGTPRRLVLRARVASRQADLVSTVTGPPVSRAFDQEGRPNQAALGFARAQGVAVEALERVSIKKGEVLCAHHREEGRASRLVLPELLSTLAGSIPFPKSMRWGAGQVAFARPIHWILALLGRESLSVTFAGVVAGRMTRGHRFLWPAPFEVVRPEAYEQALLGRQVVVDRRARLAMVTGEVERAAAEAGGSVLVDEELLVEVNDLVEYPTAVWGSFDPEFLDVPREVVITAMREHQRYFAVVDVDGRLLNRFVAVNATPARDPSLVARGHERVLRARLADARFFFMADMREPLINRLEGLKGVIYQDKLGTSYDKVMRFRRLAVWLAEELIPEARDTVDRAALLCKADLISGLVGEFPTLQGLAGTEYALRQGEAEGVAQAIVDHYRPRFAGDEPPRTDAGALVGLADRADTLMGSFGVGLRPSGTADPFGLRRQSLGLIHIILERGYRFSLKALLDRAAQGLQGVIEVSPEELSAEVHAFISARLRHLLAGKERGDVVDAALAPGTDDLVAAKARVGALGAFCRREDFESLTVAFKRVANIVEPPGVPVDRSLFEKPAEEALFARLEGLKGQIRELVAKDEYLGALEEVASVRPLVDRFFDDVLVNHEDPRVRQNRHALLDLGAGAFSLLADFRKILQ